MRQIIGSLTLSAACPTKFGYIDFISASRIQVNSCGALMFRIALFPVRTVFEPRSGRAHQVAVWRRGTFKGLVLHIAFTELLREPGMHVRPPI